MTNEQLISNTLTGFLIALIKRKGNMMTFKDLLAYTEERFDSLRKPNGRLYEGKQGVKRSLIQALNSNGIFIRVEPKVTTS